MPFADATPVTEQCNASCSRNHSSLIDSVDSAGLRARLHPYSRRTLMPKPRHASCTLRSGKARTGVRPGTNEKIQIPATKAPGFKPGKSLKDAVKG